MDLRYNTAGHPRAEVEDVELMTDIEWETVVAVKLRIRNPDGRDVIGRYRYCANPRFSDGDDGKIEARFRLPSSSSDTPDSWEAEWIPEANPTDTDALVEEAKEHATAQPAEVLDDLRV